MLAVLMQNGRVQSAREENEGMSKNYREQSEFKDLVFIWR